MNNKEKIDGYVNQISNLAPDERRELRSLVTKLAFELNIINRNNINFDNLGSVFLLEIQKVCEHEFGPEMTILVDTGDRPPITQSNCNICDKRK